MFSFVVFIPLRPCLSNWWMPNRWEYPLRCALLPVGGALALFVSVNLLLLLMGGLYLWATPANMLVAGAEQDVLETVLGGIFA